jgi:hypothetical protein
LPPHLFLLFRGMANAPPGAFVSIAASHDGGRVRVVLSESNASTAAHVAQTPHGGDVRKLCAALRLCGLNLSDCRAARKLLIGRVALLR